MTKDDIETFLTIWESGSVTKAGERLFISQGTVSLRLKNLEQELRTSLFNRGKGMKQLALTPAGEAFLPIAQQMNSLFQQAEQVKNRNLFRSLRICASDQINTSALIDFYAEYPYRHPEIALRIWTEHSRETYHLLDSRACDIGFCTTPYTYPDILTEPLYEAARVFVCRKDHPFCASQALSDLDPEMEIHVSYPTEYDAWKKTVFPEQKRCLIEVGTLGMMERFLGREGVWAVVPENFALSFLERNPDLAVVRPPFSIPGRMVYLLTHKTPLPGTEDLIQMFRKEVIEYVGNAETLDLL